LIPAIRDCTGQDSVRHLEDYPDGEKLERFIRASFPRLLIVSMKEIRKAEYIARWIKKYSPATQVAGIANQCNAETLRVALRAGMVECLGLPVDTAALGELLKSADEASAKETVDSFGRGRVISFLPAKPGVGASTTAMNTALALSRRLRDRTLLADFDLNLGLQSFLFKMTEVHSVTEAAEHAHHLDEEVWAALVAKRGSLDLLGSGYSNPGQRLEASATKELLQFWRRNYGAICLDHSGNLERYSINLLMESEEILLITTSEIAPLHLAKSRMALLREYGLAERVSLIVNRANRKDAVAREACEQCVGIPVAQFLPNDYARVEAAFFKGTHVELESALGQGYEQLADRLLPGSKKNEKTESGLKLGAWRDLAKLFSAVVATDPKKHDHAEAEVSPKA
jgi:pilus assembly protein CpaE